MKITNLQGITFVNTVNSAMKGKKLPVRVGFVIKQNMNQILKNQIEPYEEMRKELRAQHEDTEEGNKQFIEKLEELLKEETELSIKCVGLEELEKLDADPSYDKLSIQEIEAMEFMIAE